MAEERRIRVVTEYDMSSPVSQLANLEKVAKDTAASVKSIEREFKNTNDAAQKSVLAEKLAAARVEADQATTAVKNHQKTVDITAMSYNQLNNYVSRLERELKGAVKGSDEYNRTVAKLEPSKKLLNEHRADIAAIGKAGDDLNKPTGLAKYKDLLIGMFTGAAIIAGAKALFNILKDGAMAVYESTKVAEKSEAVLKTALNGNAAAAKESIQALRDLGKQTSFTTQEITDGYVKMVNRGMRPTAGEMMNLADLAASQGKGFDQMVEALLDAQTGENERLKEFGIKASKAGDTISYSFKQTQIQVHKTAEGYKVLNKTTGELIGTYATQDEAINRTMLAYGAMTGVAGANANMMETLEGKSSNLEDTFESIKVKIGEGLKPAFMFILTLMGDFLNWISKIIEESGPVISAFKDWWSILATLGSSIGDYIKTLFPGMSKEGATMAQVMQGIGIALRLIILPAQLGIVALTALYQTISGLISGGRSLVQFLNGDYAGAAKSFEASKASFTAIGKTASDSFDLIKKGLTDAFVTQPKKDTKAAVLAVSDLTDQQHKAVQELTDKQKKELEKKEKQHLEQIKKDNDEAIKKIVEMEKNATIEKIRLRDGELAATLEKLKIEYEANKKAIENSRADRVIRDKQLLLLEQQYLAAAGKLKEDARAKEAELVSRWLDGEYSKKLFAVQKEYRANLEEARKFINDKQKLAEVEVRLKKWLVDEEQKIRDEAARKELDKHYKNMLQRLENEKYVNKQIEKAEMTVLDFKVAQAKGNVFKILKVDQERAAKQLEITKRNIELETKLEETKARQTIIDAEELTKRLRAIDDKSRTEKEKAELAHQDELTRISKAKTDERSKLISSGLSGDYKSFASTMGQMMGVDVTMITKLTDAAIGKMEEMADMAIKFAQIANDLYQLRIEKQLRALEKETKATLKILNERLKAETELYESAQAAREKLISSYSEQIEQIRENELETIEALEDIASKAKEDQVFEQLKQSKAASEAKIADAQSEYQAAIELIMARGDIDEIEKASLIQTEKSKVDQVIAEANREFQDKQALAAKFTEDEIARAQKLKDEKIKAAKEAEDVAIRSARDEYNEKRIASEAYFNVAVEHINSRKDIDNATKQELIAAEQAKLAAATDAAWQEYQAKISAATQGKDFAIGEANSELTTKLAMIQALKDGDWVKVQELIANAEQEKNEKLDKAEEEKNEKLKKLEEENQRRIFEKAALEKQIAEENKAAAWKKYELDLKAFKAQQKMDMIMAAINASVATIKAMSTGIFPMNLMNAAAVTAAAYIQIEKIKSQPAPEPPEFRTGGVLAGIGGIAKGPRHGMRYRDGGIAMVDRNTGLEVGEMEGDEAIISRDQTEANRPLIDLMISKAKRGDRTPVMPLMFKHGGIMTPDAPKNMHLFGSRRRKREAQAELDKAQAAYDEAMASMSGMEGGADAMAAYAQSMEMGMQQLELLTGIKDAVLEMGEMQADILDLVAVNTGDAVAAARETAAAVREVDSRGSINALLEKIGSFS